MMSMIVIMMFLVLMIMIMIKIDGDGDNKITGQALSFLVIPLKIFPMLVVILLSKVYNLLPRQGTSW